MVMLRGSHCTPPPVSIQKPTYYSPPNASPIIKFFTARRALIFTSLLPPCWNFTQNFILPPFSHAITSQVDDIQQEEDRLVQLFEESLPSVVFIEDLELAKVSSRSSPSTPLSDNDNAKVEGTGSGFIWDNFGHIVTNFHVIAKLATDTSGLKRCKISLVDAKGNILSREGKIVGCDPDLDLAVLKVLQFT